MASFKCADMGVMCGFETKAPTKEGLPVSIDREHVHQWDRVRLCKPVFEMTATGISQARSNSSIAPFMFLNQSSAHLWSFVLS
jgi:hypothetical protein